MVYSQLGQIFGRSDKKCRQRSDPLVLVNVGLHYVATLQQAIQALQMFDVGRDVVQEHDIEDNAHHLRQRRIALIRIYLPPLFTFTSHSDCENLFCSKSNDGAEGLLQTDTPIAKE